MFSVGNFNANHPLGQGYHTTTGAGIVFYIDQDEVRNNISHANTG